MKAPIAVLIILSIATAMSLFKLMASRDASSKAVVLDVMTTITTGILVVLAFVFRSPFLLDIALVYAILSFAAVLVVARYLERGL
jgi:multicomponent Na+:H+ antiporter subunit F